MFYQQDYDIKNESEDNQDTEDTWQDDDDDEK